LVISKPRVKHAFVFDARFLKNYIPRFKRTLASEARSIKNSKPRFRTEVYKCFRNKGLKGIEMRKIITLQGIYG
jgi:hypothetical protein